MRYAHQVKRPYALIQALIRLYHGFRTTRDDPCKQLEGQIGCVLHVGVF